MGLVLAALHAVGEGEVLVHGDVVDLHHQPIAVQELSPLANVDVELAREVGFAGFGTPGVRAVRHCERQGSRQLADGRSTRGQVEAKDIVTAVLPREQAEGEQQRIAV